MSWFCPSRIVSAQIDVAAPLPGRSCPGLRAQLDHEGLDGQQRGRVGAQAAAALLDGSDPGQGLLGARRAGCLVDGLGQVEVEDLTITGGSALLGDVDVEGSTGAQIASSLLGQLSGLAFDVPPTGMRGKGHPGWSAYLFDDGAHEGEREER